MGAAVFQHCKGQTSCLAGFPLAFISEKHILAMIDLTVWFWLSSPWSLSQAGCWQTMEYYTWVLIFRKHKAYVAGSKSPALPYHRKGKMGFRGKARVQRGGSSGSLRNIPYNPSHCYGPTETETIKIIWPMFQLFEARTGVAWSLQISERYQKHSIVLSLSLFNCKHFRLHSAGAFNIMSCFILTWEAIGNQNSHSGRKKGKLFHRWCHFFLSSPSICSCCCSLWWRKKAQRTHLICCQSEDGNALIWSHSTPDSGDVSWILSQILQVRPFLD